MEKERIFDGIWNAERILACYLYYADEKGHVKYIERSDNSSDDIRRQRFYAALKAYGMIGNDYLCDSIVGHIGNESGTLLSKTRSQEKMNELRELLKNNLFRIFSKQFVDSPEFLENDFELVLFFQKLFKYRKELYALDHIWGGVLECSRSLGVLIEMTQFLYRNQMYPVCEIIDRMLILLMGDDYDKTFTEKELFQYGYPDVTDEELYQMALKEEW